MRYLCPRGQTPLAERHSLIATLFTRTQALVVPSEHDTNRGTQQRRNLLEGVVQRHVHTPTHSGARDAGGDALVEASHALDSDLGTSAKTVVGSARRHLRKMSHSVPNNSRLLACMGETSKCCCPLHVHGGPSGQRLPCAASQSMTTTLLASGPEGEPKLRTKRGYDCVDASPALPYRPACECARPGQCNADRATLPLSPLNAHRVGNARDDHAILKEQATFWINGPATAKRRPTPPPMQTTRWPTHGCGPILLLGVSPCCCVANPHKDEESKWRPWCPLQRRPMACVHQGL